MMKILVVSPFFPPVNAVASGRPYSWAKYWSQAGHDVTVLTVQHTEQALDFALPMDGFRVIRTPLPRPRWLRMLSPQVDVNAMPQSATSVRPLSLPRRLWQEAKKRYGFMSMSRMPDLHDLWASQSVDAVRQEQWDLVVTTGGPYSVHYIGQSLRRSGKARKWCVDWRDLWTHNNVFPGLPILRWLERRIESSFHRDADVVTTISQPLAETLRRMCTTQIDVIYNGFEQEYLARLSGESVFPADGVFRIVYTGTMYPHRQDPEPFFAALAQLWREGIVDPENFEVVLAGSCESMLDIAERYGVRECVKYRGMLSRTEALRMQRDAHALLLVGFRGAGQEGVMSGKIFEYLSAGPAVIAVTFDAASSVGGLLKETGRGVATGTSAKAIADLLRDWVTRPDLLRNYSGVNEHVLRYTRERQAMRMLEILS